MGNHSLFSAVSQKNLAICPRFSVDLYVATKIVPFLFESLKREEG